MLSFKTNRTLKSRGQHQKQTAMQLQPSTLSGKKTPAISRISRQMALSPMFEFYLPFDIHVDTTYTYTFTNHGIVGCLLPNSISYTSYCLPPNSIKYILLHCLRPWADLSKTCVTRKHHFRSERDTPATNTMAALSSRPLLVQLCAHY